VMTVFLRSAATRKKGEACPTTQQLESN